MRSSIACVRCRRSKVKCVNNGVGTTCRACENSGRDCAYPNPVTTGGGGGGGTGGGAVGAGGAVGSGAAGTSGSTSATATKRRDSLSARHDAAPGEPDRRRPRKSTQSYATTPAAAGMRESPRPLVDALDPHLLTPMVWQKLFDIFQTHYSVDLPFIHPPAFLRPLQAAETSAPRLTAPSMGGFETNPRPPGRPEFLLTFLALTARFHPTLVAHHSPPSSKQPSNPLRASEYYATAAHERLASMGDNEPYQDIERVQALLMLSLHEWGICRGMKAWVMLGTAIRLAQAIGLQYETELDDVPWSRSLLPVVVSNRETSHPSSDDDGNDFIQQEIRRRTFWSCFILDRYLSNGKHRPQMLRADQLRIQLPVSEHAFLFAEKVRTLMLGEEEAQTPKRAEIHGRRTMILSAGRSDRASATSLASSRRDHEHEEHLRTETGVDEGLVSRYVKVLEIYGRIVRWTAAGGRRSYTQLRRQCLDFKATLARKHTIMPQHTQAHISLKTSTPYMLMHFVYLLSVIMLNREYLPFVALRSSRPDGPHDPPIFPRDRFPVPGTFWEDSARECFKAARDIVDLARSCQEWSALVGTPVVGFATYAAAIMGVYAIHFPWLDPEGHMCTPMSVIKSEMKRSGDSKGFEAAKKAVEVLGSLRGRVRMVDGWFAMIGRVHKYFRRVKSDFRRSGIDSLPDDVHSSGQPSASSTALEESKLLDQTLRDFGPRDDDDDDDVEMTDASRGSTNRPRPSGSYRNVGPDEMDEDESMAGDDSMKSDDGDLGGGVQSSPSAPAPTSGGPWNAINTSRHPSISTPNQPNHSGGFRSYESYQSGSSHRPDFPSTATSDHRPGYSGQPLPSLRGPAASSSTEVSPSIGPPPQMSPSTSNPYPRSNPTPSHTSGPAAPVDNSPSHSERGSAPGGGVSVGNSGPHLPPITGSTGISSSWPHSSASNHNSNIHIPDLKPHLQIQAQPPLLTPHQQYTNGISSGTNNPTSAGSSAAITSATSSANLHHQSATLPSLQNPWSPTQRDSWLASLPTRFTSDDLVAFVDGTDQRVFARRAAEVAFAAEREVGWLGAVWAS